MANALKKYRLITITFVAIAVVCIGVFYSILKPKRVLPVYAPNLVAEVLVDPSIQHIKKYHTIAPFKLVNQNGDTVTDNTFDGKIYVADFFFTTCQTICPVMTDNMSQLQNALKNNPQVKLLSHTVTPEIDSVPQLKKYALEKGVKDTIWHLVTGPKETIYNLARKSYLVAKDEPYSPYGLIHTENFVLVDTKKRIRGFYDGTQTTEIDKLLEDISLLLSEK